MKYRKAYYHIEKALKVDAYGVIILIGLRKTGKTTILKQLAENHNGHYIDFRESEHPEQDYYDVYKRKEELILLDEIGYLPDFDAFFDTLEVDIKKAKKKVVITSSSYGTLTQLARERLGGGRSYRVELFPIDFEEYLLFSNKLSKYGEDYAPTVEDVQNYYRMKNIPEGMQLIVDRDYMQGMFTDADIARANHQYAVRDIELSERDVISAVDILAYSLNQAFSMKRFGNTKVGAQEFGLERLQLDLSSSLISYANENTLVLDAVTIAHIAAYLLHNGFLFVDLVINEDGRQNADHVVYDLMRVRSHNDLSGLLKQYTLSVISPLIYTRLLLDLENIAGHPYTNHKLNGALYELAIKAEHVIHNRYGLHESFKCRFKEGEVDMLADNLLLEASVGYKPDDEHRVNKILTKSSLIRVLTDEPGVFEDTGVYYRIGYPKALLMLSNGSIYDLEKRKAVDSLTANE